MHERAARDRDVAALRDLVTPCVYAHVIDIADAATALAADAIRPGAAAHGDALRLCAAVDALRAVSGSRLMACHDAEHVVARRSSVLDQVFALLETARGTTPAYDEAVRTLRADLLAHDRPPLEQLALPSRLAAAWATCAAGSDKQ
jgi:hypothetical protein